MTLRWMKLGLAATAAAVLSACGGGGGSSGSTDLQYSITLRADRTTLPINISGIGPGTGVYSPYTTTLYVQAMEGRDPILGRENAFSCNVAGGLQTGSLYYLDGKDEHMVTQPDGTKVPGAYRSIVLGANAGGNSFHFHADDEAGTVTITCTVTDPRDNRVYSATQTITVGAATGKPASVQPKIQAPYYLGSRDNVRDIRNNVGLQVLVHDDANQIVPNPAASNLQISILPNDASVGARLLSGNQSGSVVRVRTTAGVGQMSLSSGPKTGAILLELTTDRFDNNVDNGIQDPITQLTVVPVVDAVADPNNPLTLPEETELTVTNGIPYAYAMVAQGGVPPYLWSASGLPSGLTMTSNGLISGTPNAPAGTYTVVVRLTDETDRVLTANLTIKLEGPTALERAFALNCISGSGNTCVLPEGTAGEPYSYIFSASNATPETPITWSFSPASIRGLTGDAATGTISGTPTESINVSCQPIIFQVTATQGSQSLTRVATIQMTCPQPPEPEEDSDGPGDSGSGDLGFIFPLLGN